MQTADGHELRGDNQKIQIIPCTRWVELQGALAYHIELAGMLQATTVFRMLNDPGRVVGPQVFTVGDIGSHNDNYSMAHQVQQALTVIEKATPRGVTPLTQHLQDIAVQVTALQETLRNKGQEVVIVLATDGLPSNHLGESSESVLQEFLLELKAIQSLPVWVVIRLCTDDEKVVNYYNSLDAEVRNTLLVVCL